MSLRAGRQLVPMRRVPPGEREWSELKATRNAPVRFRAPMAALFSIPPRSECDMITSILDRGAKGCRHVLSRQAGSSWLAHLWWQRSSELPRRARSSSDKELPPLREEFRRSTADNYPDLGNAYVMFRKFSRHSELAIRLFSLNFPRFH